MITLPTTYGETRTVCCDHCPALATVPVDSQAGPVGWLYIRYDGEDREYHCCSDACLVVVEAARGKVV